MGLGRVSRRLEIGEAVERRISGQNEIWTSAVSLMEIVSKYRRKGLPEDKAIEAIGSLSRFGILDREDAAEVGRLHAQVKARSPNFSLADAFTLQLARKLRAKVLTGDPGFKGIKEAEFVS